MTHAVAALWLVLAAQAVHAQVGSYPDLRGAAALTRRAHAATEISTARAAIEGSVLQLAQAWMGTAWGLGAPQLEAPSASGHINCGTFVGTVLRDAGFRVNVKSLQMQTAQNIIRTFVTGSSWHAKDHARRFSNVDIAAFDQAVQAMGPGLYIIGLDFHVGFLYAEAGRPLRFIHASYETRTVVDEPALTAGPIVSSNYRVVGKILIDDVVRKWQRGDKMPVVGTVRR